MSFDIKYGLWPILDSVLDFDKYSQYSLKDYIAAIYENSKVWGNREHGLYFLSRDAQSSGEIASVAHHMMLKNMIHFDKDGEFVVSGDFDGVQFGENGYETVYCDYKLKFFGVQNFNFIKKEFSLKDLKLLRASVKNFSNLEIGKNGLFLSQCYQVGNKFCFIVNAKTQDGKKKTQRVCFYEISFDYATVKSDIQLSALQRSHYMSSSFNVLSQKVDYTKNCPKFKKRKLKKSKTPNRIDLKYTLSRSAGLF